MTIEELQEMLLQVQEELKATKEQQTQLSQTIAEKDNRITELQEANQKLFLRVTTPYKEQEEDKPYESKLLGDYATLLDDRELEFLKQIEEEL